MQRGCVSRRYLPRAARRQERHRLRAVRPRHPLPRRGRHGERHVHRGLLLPERDGDARAVRAGHVLPARVDGAGAVRGGHVEQRDGAGGGVRCLPAGLLLPDTCTYMGFIDGGLFELGN